MLIRIKGAHIVDPANRRDEIGDLWIRDDEIVAAPQDGAQADETVDASGLIAMAGGIDIHSHIAGANVNTARLMLPEHHRAHARRPAETPLSRVGWTTFETGRLYAEMGFTTVVEPAVSPHQCAARASRTCRHPDHRQGDSGDTRQRRFRARPPAFGRRRERAPRSCRLDIANDARAWDQGRQRRRRRGVQRQHPQLFV